MLTRLLELRFEDGKITPIIVVRASLNGENSRPAVKYEIPSGKRKNQ